MVGLLRKQRVAEGLGELVFCGTAEDWGYSSWWHFISRICGIRVSVDDGDRSAMSVNLPCLDQGLGCNKEHLVELERVVSESELWVQSLCLHGDFNAHLGAYVGPGEPNVQKVLLQEVMEKLYLSAVSLGILASGPGNTYWRGDVWTIVYYVWMLKLCH